MVRLNAVLIAALIAQDLPAVAPVAPLPIPFNEWLAGVRAEAVERGLRPEVIDGALADVEPVAQVLERDRSQPEFTLDLETYLKRRLTRPTVRTAQQMYTKHRALLRRISDQYGVNPRILVSVWGIESNFGRFSGVRPTISTLATLAYDPRRSAFFRGELFSALEILDRAYFRIGQTLGTYPTDPIPVVLYTAEQFRDITRSPSWAAGAYDGTIRVPMRGALDKREELDRVLSHEFTHALIRTLAARGVPTWLNEGLATRMEKVTGTVPLRALQNGFGRFTGEQAQVAYAASALAARRLLNEAGGAAITNLLTDLGEGVDFESAFLHRIQRSFAEFQQLY